MLGFERCLQTAALPLSDSAFEYDAYLVVFDPNSQSPLIFQQRVLPFGSIASVTSFLRLSLALWKLGSGLLQLMWSSYFDDFLSVSEIGLEKHTDMVISFLFTTLGWKLSVEKLLEFDTVCKVLGVKLDLSSVPLKSAVMCNTPERTEELIADIQGVLLAGRMGRKDAERLRGRLQFASGQIFGRAFRNFLRPITEHISSGRKNLSPALIDALHAIMSRLRTNEPRAISGRLSDYVHVYVDASFEPEGYSGVGGIVLSSSGECLGCFSEKVSDAFLADLKLLDRKTVIQELEALAVLVAAKVFQNLFENCKVVILSDSESVRFSFLKAWSKNEECSKVLLGVFEVEELLQSQFWIERVPSQSNPADDLSRNETDNFKGILRTRCDIHSLWKSMVQSRGDGAAI